MAIAGENMKRPTLYIFRGKHSWMISYRGMPEDDEIPESVADPSSSLALAPFSREADVEVVLKEVQRLHPEHEVRVLNWDRPKRDYQA